MLMHGYVYWDHLPSLIERAMNKAAVPHREQLRVARVIRKRLGKRRPDKQPDYAFETSDSKVALAEAKGAFVPPDGSPRMIKGDLKHGLHQLSAWAPLIAPIPHKSFAVGLYLREEGDPHHDPSLLAFVDPPDDDNQFVGAAPFPRDWVRRGNYGAWLRGMGLEDAGFALRSGRTTEVRQREFPIIAIGGHHFAIVLIGPMNTLPWFDFFRDDIVRLFPPFFRSRVDVQILGIEVRNLRAIEKVISIDDAALPMNMSIEVATQNVFPEWLSGSVFPDGTLFGMLHLDRHTFPIVDTETFKV